MLVVAAFALVAALVTVSPGPDTMLVLSAVVGHGRKTALFTVAGVVCGLLVWGALVVAEAAVAMVWPVLATLVHIGGGVYLAVVGIWSIRNGVRPVPLKAHGGFHGPGTFLNGFVGNLLNPKVGLFYLGLLPLFVGLTGSTVVDHMILASMHAVESLVWLSAVAVGGARYQRLLTLSRAARGTRLAFVACLLQLGAEVAGGFAGAFGGGQAGAVAADGPFPGVDGMTEMGEVLGVEHGRPQRGDVGHEAGDAGGAVAGA